MKPCDGEVGCTDCEHGEHCRSMLTDNLDCDDADDGGAQGDVGDADDGGAQGDVGDLP